MSEKTTRTLYRSVTLLLALFIFGGLIFTDAATTSERMSHLGLFDALRLQYIITYAVPLGMFAILTPKIPQFLKERAYAGISFVYIWAFIAHGQIDGFSALETYFPLLAFAVLMASYVFWHKNWETTKTM